MTDTLTASRGSRARPASSQETEATRSSANHASSAPVLPPAPVPATAALPSWNLTPQQWRVFLLVGRALSNKAIAHELKVAESTVKAHISAIFKVSGCRNRTEAALLSLRVRYGLLEPVAESVAPGTALDNLRRASKVRGRT